MAQITAKLDKGLAVRLSNGRHVWTADEPLDKNGTDSGPNPYELLLSALAACTCVTISWYCQHKGISLNSVSANYDFARIHIDDCQDCDMPDRGFLEKVTSDVHMEGDFDEAQKKRLAQIVERCPVRKTLAFGIEFDSNATFAGEKEP